MNQLIGHCGLDCEKCEARIATVNNDNKLREEVARKWAELNDCPDIRAEHINCMGCRTEGVKSYYCTDLCEIRKCVMAKGYATCGDCAEWKTCKILAPMIQYHEEAAENLKNK